MVSLYRKPNFDDHITKNRALILNLKNRDATFRLQNNITVVHKAAPSNNTETIIDFLSLLSL